MAATAMIAGPARNFSGLLPTVSRKTSTRPKPRWARAVAAGDPVPRAAPAVPGERRDGAHEHADGAGVGAEVDAVVARTAVPVEPGEHGADRGERQHRPGAAVRRHDLDEQQQDEGPDDVELLLDRERPQVGQRGVSAVEGVHPVDAVHEHDADLLERGADVDGVPDAVAAGGGRDPRGLRERQEHAHPDAEHDEQRRQQAQGPPRVELRQRHPAVHADLVQQHRRDEEAGQDEEDVQPDPAALERTGARGEVVGDDPDEREAAQAVQRR